MKNKDLKVLKTISFDTIWRHITYAHRNGLGDPLKVQQIVLNALAHFRNDHTNCAKDSKCKKASYELKRCIVEPHEVKELLDFLTRWSTMVSGKVIKHCWGLANYLCESIHNLMIKYASKRISLGPLEYEMRIVFSNLDYTENLKNKYKRDKTYVWQKKLMAMFYSIIN